MQVLHNNYPPVCQICLGINAAPNLRLDALKCIVSKCVQLEIRAAADNSYQMISVWLC